MAPRYGAPTPPATTNTTQTPATPPKDEARDACVVIKRIAFAFVNLITLALTCVYISHAWQHHEIINENADVLKNPYGALDLPFEKVGYVFAIGRAGLLGIGLLTVLSVPEWMIFLYSVVVLVFEVPMACVAESTFGYLVNFAQLDLSPSHVHCSNTTMTETQWQFFTAYGDVAGRLPVDVCQEFVHEGAVLRGSLLFPWFTLWITFFVVAFVISICKPDRSWSTFFLYFTGVNFSFSWAGVKRFFTPKIALPRIHRRRARSVDGDSSTSSETLAERVHVEVCEKV